ncbi:PPOX class F420-dependent oxidoreductase [Dictyobacter aurantiacus]|uniref:PPOX class F420-dependent oxidoreductase n=1 Tax=Dictyobacter aurantiacus TaxID=1936993 RepID=A0A401ZNY6_9CHLR|nr:PPOX class F420-dependent oxidoreductase [Dictyobacter aurantiacus]GCE08504.1 PPOX class F420-dependent oxidoreductase [Dictyobacter aurantiacus]
MTILDNNVQDPFAFLAPHEFLVLTTYRRDGRAVPTTVWFAYEQGKVYVTTSQTTGKIKRIRATGRVSMSPSDRIGNLKGEPTVDGVGRDASPEERPAARAALANKYGAAFQRIVGEDTPNRVYIVIEPTTR